ncbi:MAG: rRNA maturation RNase YbeY [Flavobacteriales bacterium]
MAQITFHSEDISYTLPDKALVRRWIIETAASYGKSVSQVAFVFCSDTYLLEMNKQYLQHDYFTDIITFDYSEGDVISGDIFISIDRVQDNAREHRVDNKFEMQRVVIHGILHLCGLKDKTKTDAEKMRKSEEIALSKFPQKHSNP